MMPPCSQVGPPRHFQSSRTSVATSGFSARTLARASPRQSPSSSIRPSISFDGDSVIGAILYRVNERFRQVLSHVPTGVAGIAGGAGDVPAGLAVGAFPSISLEPPLVGFFCDRDSTSWPPIRETGAFCAN